jgi:AraC family transcriptional regulator of adaptative response/methylated-DNA-[protein]-cysteine methyltransferase
MTSTFANTGKSTLSSVAEDPRWSRIVAREKTADGHLWYSVSTTGIYCRPSCPSRKRVLLDREASPNLPPGCANNART